jgi:hypothetical protein
MYAIIPDYTKFNCNAIYHIFFIVETYENKNGGSLYSERGWGLMREELGYMSQYWLHI